MPVGRIDGFSGDDHAYAEYLFKAFSGISIHQCTQWLEKGLTQIRQTDRRASFRVRYLTPPPDQGDAVFRIWNPSSEYKPSEYKPSEYKPSEYNQRLPANQSAGLTKEVASFLAGMPASEEEWLNKRKSVGLSNSDDILSVVDCLSTHRFSNNSFGIPELSKCADLQDALMSMARSVGSLMATGKLHYNISQFMSLVFTAICCVALDQGHPQKAVEAVQRDSIRTKGVCNANSKQLGKHRSTVRWLLQEMQRQFRRGLGHRAFEIFINGKKIALVFHQETNLIPEGKTLHFYTKCPKGSESNERFTNTIPLCEVPDEIQASLPLWIPFFVKLNSGDRWR